MTRREDVDLGELSSPPPPAVRPHAAPDARRHGLIPRLAVFLLLVACGVIVARNYSTVLGKAAGRDPTPRGELAGDEKETIRVFEQVSPSVVHIRTSRFQRDVWRRRILEVRQGTGSGVVWDDTGHIVTNYHVLAGASKVYVALVDGEEHEAVLVFGAPDMDVILLKLVDPPSNLRPIPLGESHDLKVGQRVLAIGNPFGLDQTLTTGVISAVGRQITAATGEEISDVIQTDAAINPGNSGGPLLDSAGRMVGINTAIVSPSGAYAGVGFAIPIDTVRETINGGGRRAGLGIQTREVSEGVRQRLRVGGLIVIAAPPQSAAARAGIREYDVIAAIDDKPTPTQQAYNAIMRAHRVGDRVRVTVERDGKRLELSVELQEIP